LARPERGQSTVSDGGPPAGAANMNAQGLVGPTWAIMLVVTQGVMLGVGLPAWQDAHAFV
jgi:hypothetical protein